MSYRDATLPIRLRVGDLRDQVAECEKRIAPFRDELAPPLKRRLKRLAALVDDASTAPTDASGWLAIERALAAQREALVEAVQATEKLEQRLNALPYAFPGRISPRDDYQLPDPYDDYLGQVRADAHAQLHAIDPAVTCFDLRPRYFDAQELPYLVHAAFRAEGTPLRLHLHSRASVNAVGTYEFRRWFATLVTLVPPSTPELSLSPERWTDKLKKLLHLGEEAAIADAEQGSRFIICGSHGAADHLLTPEVRELLASFADEHEPALAIAGGVALIEWRGSGGRLLLLDRAIALLAALRAIVPRSRSLAVS